MKPLFVLTSVVAVLCVAIVVSAQPLQEGGGKREQRSSSGRGGAGGGATRNKNSETGLQGMMGLDANGDGVLTPAEVTDPRLQVLLQRADTNADSRVTQAELRALIATEGMSAGQSDGPRGPGMGPPPGADGQGRPRPGEVMPSFIMDHLQLNQTQRQQMAVLQQQVDARLAEILSAEQQQQLRTQGVGGFGGPGMGPPAGSFRNSGGPPSGDQFGGPSRQAGGQSRQKGSGRQGNSAKTKAADSE